MSETSNTSSGLDSVAAQVWTSFCGQSAELDLMFLTACEAPQSSFDSSVPGDWCGWSEHCMCLLAREPTDKSGDPSALKILDRGTKMNHRFQAARPLDDEMR